MPIFCAACAEDDAARLRAAGQAVGETRAEKALPDLPEDCRRRSYSGVGQGDRLDVALLKTDAALTRQNARTRRCADWYDDLQEGFRQDGPR